VAEVLSTADAALTNVGTARPDVPPPPSGWPGSAGQRTGPTGMRCCPANGQGWPGPYSTTATPRSAAASHPVSASRSTPAPPPRSRPAAPTAPPGMGWWGQHATGAIGLVSETLKAAFLAEIGATPETALGHPCWTSTGWRTSPRSTTGSPAAGTRPARRRGRGPPSSSWGDPVAAEIVAEQGRRLAFYAEFAARHAGLHGTGSPIPVVLSGSILADSDSPVAAGLCEQLPRTLPGADPRRAPLSPVASATLDALAEGGIPITPAVTAPSQASCRLRRSFRPAGWSASSPPTADCGRPVPRPLRSRRCMAATHQHRWRYQTRGGAGPRRRRHGERGMPALPPGRIGGRPMSSL
jgi:hypothetical protein